MLRDYLAAMAQLKLPIRVRIVLLLASIEADAAPIHVSQRDLAMVLQQRDHRHLQKALEWLSEARMIELDPGRGSRPAVLRLRPPEEWLEPRWVVERKLALAWVAYVRDRRAARKALLCAPEMGALGPVVRKPKRGARGIHSAPLQGAHNADPTAPERRAHNGGPIYYLSPERAPEGANERGREGVLELTPHEERLVAAFMRGAGLSELQGWPLRRLRAIAAEANGSFEALVSAAERGPEGKWVDHLKVLEHIKGSTTMRPPSVKLCERCGLPDGLPYPCLEASCPKEVTHVDQSR